MLLYRVVSSRGARHRHRGGSPGSQARGGIRAYSGAPHAHAERRRRARGGDSGVRTARLGREGAVQGASLRGVRRDARHGAHARRLPSGAASGAPASHGSLGIQQEVPTASLVARRPRRLPNGTHSQPYIPSFLPFLLRIKEGRKGESEHAHPDPRARSRSRSRAHTHTGDPLWLAASAVLPVSAGRWRALARNHAPRGAPLGNRPVRCALPDFVGASARDHGFRRADAAPLVLRRAGCSSRRVSSERRL